MPFTLIDLSIPHHYNPVGVDPSSLLYTFLRLGSHYIMATSRYATLLSRSYDPALQRCEQLSSPNTSKTHTTNTQSLHLESLTDRSQSHWDQASLEAWKHQPCLSLSVPPLCIASICRLRTISELLIGCVSCRTSLSASCHTSTHRTKQSILRIAHAAFHTHHAALLAFCVSWALAVPCLFLRQAALFLFLAPNRRVLPLLTLTIDTFISDSTFV